MKQVKNSGTTIVFVSHNLNWVKLICDRAILLRRGRIAADGPPRQVISAYHSQSK
jgi:lipopolysaccharide transport system ATP-binding protein